MVLPLALLRSLAALAPVRTTAASRAAPAQVGRGGVMVEIRLDHCVVAVSDWNCSNAFYHDVLGAELVELDKGRHAYRFGGQQLNVHGPGSEPHPRAAEPVRPGNSDLCFVWDGPIDRAVAHLEASGVEVELGPVERTGGRGRGMSVYFRDPDGSLLELISYSATEPSSVSRGRRTASPSPSPS